MRSISAIQELCQNTDQDGVGVQDVPDSADNNGGILLDAVDISLSTPDGQRRLLDRASLQLSRNTNVLCMGRSGLGKSSMARVCVGVTSQTDIFVLRVIYGLRYVIEVCDCTGYWGTVVS